jgi:chromatin modification-related protein VID21
MTLHLVGFLIGSKRAFDDRGFLDLFEGNKPANLMNMHSPPPPPKDAYRRAMSQLWTERDDKLLKTLSERYPNNWPLIADSYNSSGVTIITDRRTAWDCFERWSTRFGPGSTLRNGSQDSSSAVEMPQPPLAQMTTRGVKRLASAVSGMSAGASAPGHEPKKMRRHALMHDAIRKAAKKRDMEKKANGK